MRNVYTNQYKRHDIFSCNHSAHHRFAGMVSTYYILEEKKCYPEGCINFIWRCRLLNKGHACPKKFTHVGRKCFSCKHYYEEKYMQQPKLLVSPEEFQTYLREKEDFDYWIEKNNGRLVAIDAEISAVKPDLSARIGRGRQSFHLDGWILVFDKVYVGYDLFDDTAFARISIKAQDKWQFSAGCKFEAKARFRFQRGRLIFNRLHDIEIVMPGDGDTPDPNRILVATQTATEFPVQPEKCLSCPEGVLVEKTLDRREKNGPKRILVCLRGEKNPADCLYHLAPLLKSSK